MNAEIRASITVPPQCIPAAAHPAADNDAQSHWGALWGSHMGSRPQGGGIIAVLGWCGGDKHSSALLLAWCVVTWRWCWFSEWRGVLRVGTAIPWWSRRVCFVFTSRKKRKAQVKENTSGLAGRGPLQYETFYGQPAAISVMPQYSILWTLLKCLWLCFWTPSFLLLHVSGSILNCLATPDRKLQLHGASALLLHLPLYINCLKQQVVHYLKRHYYYYYLY